MALPERSKGQVAYRAFEVFFDAFTFFIAVFDVISDVIVAYQFYKDERYGYFYASCTIFILAQLAFAYYFVGTYGPSRVDRKIHPLLLFLAVLPFSELVPIFSFLDAYSWSPTRPFIKALGLRARSARPDPQGQSLHEALKSKAGQHSCFFVETIIQAIPQSLLQLIAMVTAQEASTISILSVLLSVLSIASKAYIISYSAKLKLFIFNSLCFVYDLFALFFTVTMLFGSPGEGPTNSSSYSSDSTSPSPPTSSFPLSSASSNEALFFDSLAWVDQVWFFRLFSVSGLGFLTAFVWWLHQFPIRACTEVSKRSREHPPSPPSFSPPPPKKFDWLSPPLLPPSSTPADSKGMFVGLRN